MSISDPLMVGGLAGHMPMRAEPDVNAPTIQAPGYFEELCQAMGMLGVVPNSIFMGQAVAYPGTAMQKTFRDVPENKLLELPVAEDMQLGMAIGMSLNGYLPICCYPRWNFLLLATSQLVLHLDKISLYSGYRPKVIIRTAVGSDSPLNPGHQHLGDFSEAYREMLQTVEVVVLDRAEEIVPKYHAAFEREGSTLLVEYSAKY